MNPNDRVNPSSKALIVVNGTVRKSYYDVGRETNFLAFNFTDTEIYYYSYRSVYFDKATGALVKYYEEYADSEGIGGYSISLTQSSVWAVSEFPSLLVLPLLMIAIAFGALLYRKKLSKPNLL